MFDAAAPFALESGAPYTTTIEITNNHVYVPVRAGARDFWFLLDTGAGVSLLNERVATALKIPLGARFPVRGAGDGELSGAMLSRPLLIQPGGHDPLAIEVTAMMPLAHLEPHEGRAIDGILGYDFLMRHVVRIDYPAKRLSLYRANDFTYDGDGTVVPLTIRNGHPHVAGSLRLSDETVVDGDFVIDIGSSLPLTITGRFAETHRLRTMLEQSFRAAAGRGIGAPTSITVGRIRALHLGDLTISQAVVGVFGEGAGVMSSGEFFDGNIGGALLREFVLTLDYARLRLILEPSRDSPRGQ
jgi:Aspartyl protease